MRVTLNLPKRVRCNDLAKPAHEVFSKEFIDAFAAEPYDPTPVGYPPQAVRERLQRADDSRLINVTGMTREAFYAFLRGIKP